MWDTLKTHVDTMNPLPVNDIIPGNVYVGHASGKDYQFWARVAIISVDTENDTAKVRKFRILTLLRELS